MCFLSGPNLTGLHEARPRLAQSGAQISHRIGHESAIKCPFTGPSISSERTRFQCHCRDVPTVS